MRWHHYAGLIAGVTTVTWVFSGLLSMDPWDWHPSTAPTRPQRDAVSGGPLRPGPLTADRIRRALGTMTAARDVEVVQFRGEPFLAASGALVSLAGPASTAIPRFPDAAMEDAARAAMPGVAVDDVTRLDAYDDYYYDRTGDLPLPVVRVRFADPPRTWLYLDPARGVIVRKEERLTRINRWL